MRRSFVKQKTLRAERFLEDYLRFLAVFLVVFLAVFFLAAFFATFFLAAFFFAAIVYFEIV